MQAALTLRLICNPHPSNISICNAIFKFLFSLREIHFFSPREKTKQKRARRRTCFAKNFLRSSAQNKRTSLRFVWTVFCAAASLENSSGAHQLMRPSRTIPPHIFPVEADLQSGSMRCKKGRIIFRPYIIIILPQLSLSYFRCGLYIHRYCLRQ